MLDRPVGFWARGIAFLIDLLILQCLFLILAWVGKEAMNIALTILGLESPSKDLIFILTHLYFWVGIILVFSYFFFFLLKGGQTPAKRLFRFKVMTTEYQPLDWRNASLRTLAYLLSGPFLFGLGFLLIAVHPKKRALHDLIAGTIEIHDPS